MSVRSREGINLLPEITCPNCWKKFPPEKILAIAGSPELTGDSKLSNPDEKRRFPPTRFTPEGQPIDVKGSKCQEFACPHCHLLVPGVLFERTPGLFISAFGRAQSGKSYCLAAASHMLLTKTARQLGLSITEPHTKSNSLVRSYRRAIFNIPDPEASVQLPKTEIGGDLWYHKVRYSEDDSDIRQYPRPMFYQVKKTDLDNYKQATANQQVETICLYDNAGEHFEPGHDKPDSPETQHLSRSSALIFVFDPTQEPIFLRECLTRSSDPQFNHYGSKTDGAETQDVILATADQNVKRQIGRELAEPLDMPLVITVAKFDAWKHMVKGELPDFLVTSRGDEKQPKYFDLNAVESISKQMRKLLVNLCPEIVTAAERMSNTVCYIPTSSTGCGPFVDGHTADGNPIFKHRAGSIQPVWAEVPMLWILSQLTTNLVPILHSRKMSHPQTEQT